MAYPKKVERNLEIVKKKDSGMSFRQLASHYNLKTSTLHQIYHREKKALNKDVRSLSTQ